jgi:hypothetical protein
MKLGIPKIATLPTTVYNPDLSFFERTSDLSARYISLARSFAEKNGIDFIILSGISYTNEKYSLRRIELLNNEKIDSDRFKNPNIIFIDGNKALQNIGTTSENSEVNKKFQNYQEHINADIILNSAIYVSSQANKTDDFVYFFNESKTNNSQQTKKENYFCIIDVNFIWKNETLKRVSKNNNPSSDAKIVDKINSIIIDFAKSNDIDIIINGNYSNRICNITDSIQKLIDSDFK